MAKDDEPIRSVTLGSLRLPHVTCACRIGAEGILSKKVAGAYWSHPCCVWFKVRDPATIAMQRERSKKWKR